MFKYFYKTVLISILCGSLLMLDFSYKSVSMNQARAETVTTGGGLDSDLMSTLTMVAIGAITSRLIMYGKITPDIAVAAAGGVAFVAGDIVANKQLEKALKEIKTNIITTARKDINDEQRQYILRLIDSYKSAKNTASTKKKMQLAAAAAFGIAAATAYFMKASELTAEASCDTSISALEAAASTACSSVVGSAAGCACVATLNGAFINSLVNYVTDRIPPSPTCEKLAEVNTMRSAAMAALNTTGVSCAAIQPAGAATVTACNSMFGMNIGYETGCLPPATLALSSTAIFALMGLKDGAIGAALAGIAFHFTNVVDNALFVPHHRAIMWGVLAGLAFSASNSTSSQMGKIDGDIAKLEGLLQSIDSNENSTHTQVAYKSASETKIKNTNSEIGNSNAVENKDVTMDAALPCFTSKDPGAKGKDCPSMSALAKDIQIPEGMGDVLKTNIGSVLKLGDGLNGTNKIAKSTFDQASELGSNFAVSKKLMEDAKKKFLETNKKIKKPIDVAQAEKKFNDGLKQAFEDGLKKAKISGSALASSMGSNSISSNLNKQSEVSLKKLGKKIDLGTTPSESLPASESLNTTLSTEEPKKDTQEVAAAAAPTTSIDEYDLKNDIHTDKSENIFNVISSRYQKSGYPRLFKRLSE